MSRRNYLPRILVLLLCAARAINTLADDIYRTVDAQGNVTYSDHAIGPASHKMTVDVIAANPENAARLAKEQSVVNASTAERDKAEREDAAEQQRRQLESSAQKQRCEAARARYAAFAAGGRIWKPDEQGNRVFYSDQEIAAERIRSKTAMDAVCGQ